MVGSGLNLEEFMGSQRQDHFVNLERRRDWEVSVHTTNTSGSQSQRGSHVSHEKDTKAMQREIDHLRRRLRRDRRGRTPFNPESSFGDDRDGSYKRRLRTPPMNLSHMMRITIVNAEIGTCLAKTWEMTL